MSAIALYTAVYPGAARFLAAWYASVQAQADRDFDLWISLDGLTEAAVAAQLGHRPAATFVVAETGSTPAQVRQQALTRIADHYDAVVLVDSDDLLHPDRVAAARAWLDGADVAACGLRLVDEAGQPLGVSLATPGEGEAESDPAPHQRVRALEHGLPVRRAASLPADPGRGRPGGLVPDHDGLAPGRTAGLRSDATDGLSPARRKHGPNPVAVHGGARAGRHGAGPRALPAGAGRPAGADALPARATQVREAAADVAAFDQRVVEDAAGLSRYVRELNAAPPPLLWWASVAHPPLRSQWSTQKEPT